VVNEYSGGRVHVDRAAITCPVLVVGGEEDVSQVHKQRRIAEFYGAELIMSPGFGHDIMLERRAFEVADAIDKWIQKLSF
jgi:pimeloyl-ACP methyl ester carboxylesterase